MNTTHDPNQAIYWRRTHKGHPAALALADRHYSRQHPGSNQFCRPGENLVWVTLDRKAVWVSHRSKWRKDGIDAWECTIFRNEGSIRSSELIREAQRLTWAEWGEPPKDGMITYVDTSKILTEVPGYCYRRAGWKSFGMSKGGKVRLKAPTCSEEKAGLTWGFYAMGLPG